MTHLRVVAALACLAAAPYAMAQSAAPAAAPAAAPVDTSKCGKPDPHPGRMASTQKLKGWNNEVATWQECMKKHIGTLQAKADDAVKSANAAVADSNAAIASYNVTVKELQAQAEAAK